MSSNAILAENRYSRIPDLRRENWAYRFDRVRRAIYQAQWKYIASSDGHDELYDVVSDPHERENLLETSASPAGIELATQLARCGPEVPSAGRPPRTRKPLTEAEIERLRSLGYL